MTRWIIWALGAFFFFAEYLIRVAPSVMTTDLMRDFGVTAMTLGNLSAFFYYAYVGMQLPVGMLVDRLGPRRLLTAMVLVCGAGCWLFSAAQNIVMADFGRFLMGFGGAFAFVGTLKLASVWFDAKHFAVLVGLTQALGMLGAAVGEHPMSIAVSQIGWRETMLIAAAIFFALGLLMYWIVRDHPEGESLPTLNTNEEPKLLAGLKIVLKSKQTWVNACFIGLLYAPTAAFAELWGVSYLSNVHHITKHIAAGAVSMIFIGWAIGSPVMGWLSDYFETRRKPMLLSALLGLILMSTILYMPNISVTSLYVLLFVYGLTNTGVIPSYAVAGELQPKQLTGTSLAFANMAAVIIGACYQPVIGGLLDLHWNGVIQNGAPVYSSSDYQWAMMILPATLILCLISGLFVKETFHLSANSSVEEPLNSY